MLWPAMTAMMTMGTGDIMVNAWKVNILQLLTCPTACLGGSAHYLQRLSPENMDVNKSVLCVSGNGCE